MAGGNQKKRAKRRANRPNRSVERQEVPRAPGTGSARPLTPAASPTNWRLIAGIMVLAAVLALVGFLLINRSQATAPTLHGGTPIGLKGTAKPGATASSSNFPTLAKVIDGIPCNAENVTYHEHAHLEILDRGNPVTVPADIGIIANTCLYWLHTHDASGEIHMEMPRYRPMTLGNVFDVWGQSLSRSRVAQVSVTGGETMRVYLNGKIDRGSPRTLTLHRHSLVTIEVGPPFKPPSTFDFQGD